MWQPVEMDNVNLPQAFWLSHGVCWMSGWQGECDTFFLFLKIELWSFQWDYSGAFVGDVVVATVVQVKASIRERAEGQQLCSHKDGTVCFVFLQSNVANVIGNCIYANVYLRADLTH